jgi:para-nitrobenzyl esterase
VLVALALMLAGCGRGDPVAAPRVQSDGETLTGAPGERYPQVASFKGIPFAAPPVGALRWQAPQPHAPRSGIQPAVAFASACFQDSYNTDWYRRVGAAFGARGSRFIEPSVSEDCLNLNVWTPALDADAMLPVMVWFYGGSNLAGWSY